MTKPLGKNPVLSRLPADLRRDLVDRSHLERYAAGEIVLSEGDPSEHIFALESGALRVFHASAAGVQVVLKIFRAPALFGEAEALSEVPYAENVSAVEASEVLLMPVAVVLEVLHQDGACATAFLQDVATRFAIAIQLQKSIAFDPITTRLANYLIAYAAGVNEPGAPVLRVDLTQDDMAAAIAASRRSIAEDIITWQNEGILERRGKFYVIRDLERLRGYCDPANVGINYRLGDPLVPAADRLAAIKPKRTK